MTVDSQGLFKEGGEIRNFVPHNLCGSREQNYDYYIEWGPASDSNRTLVHQSTLIIPCTYNSCPKYLDKEFLLFEYMTNKKSIKCIAQEVGCAHSTLLKYFKIHGIGVRNKGLSGSDGGDRTGQLAYGTKWLNGKIVEDKKEKAIIQKMRRLRDSGHTYRKIASILNDMRIPTKTGAGLWHAKSVWIIFKRKTLLFLSCML